MRYCAIATGFDDTLATGGRVAPDTVAALERTIESGRKLILVTGRQLPDLKEVFPRLDLFQRVVAENGAVLYRPDSGETKALAAAPRREFVDALRKKGLQSLSIGEIVVATSAVHDKIVLSTIRDLGLELHLIYNKSSLMVLPSSVDKATGLLEALRELNLSEHRTVGIGDAENDRTLLGACECGVAVANAVESLRKAAHLVTCEPNGKGVQELVERVLSDDWRTVPLHKRRIATRAE